MENVKALILYKNNIQLIMWMMLIVYLSVNPL